MVGSSPRLGRASHHYLSSGGNIKTKAVGRNSESKRLDSIYAWSYFGWLCDSRRLIIEKGSLDLSDSSSIVWTSSDIRQYQLLPPVRKNPWSMNLSILVGTSHQKIPPALSCRFRPT